MAQNPQVKPEIECALHALVRSLELEPNETTDYYAENYQNNDLTNSPAIEGLNWRACNENE
jgi:hypothetical protein